MFKYVAQFSGRKSVGTLRWDADRYAAVSGPYAEGTLPVGKYEVKKRDVVANPDMDEPYCITDPKGKICFFIPLDPEFDTHRTGFGIHPDGNVLGSEGCVVLDAADTRAFWKKWNATAMAQRPTRLDVEAITAAKKKAKKKQTKKAKKAVKKVTKRAKKQKKRAR
jgi:hypothetical protein